MSAREITIRVDEASAKAFSSAPSGDRRKMELLLALRLQELTHGPQRSLQAIMDELSAQAKARGLTPGVLESLLNDQ